MIRAYRFILCVAVLIAAVSGCVQPVEIEPPAEREVFVKCILMNDTIQKVTLLYTGVVGDQTFEPVKEASVMVIGPKQEEYVFEPSGDGNWTCDFQPYFGSYALHIKIPGRDPIEAETVYPQDYSLEAIPFAPEQWRNDVYEVRQKYNLPLNRGGRKDDIISWIYEQYNPYLDDAFRKEGTGTCMNREMPGMAFRIDTDEDMTLYVIGVQRDTDGTLSRIKRLGTNHLGVDKANMLKETFCASDIYPGDTSRFIQYDERGPVFTPELQDAYTIAAMSHYNGLPLFDGFIRIEHKADYDNQLRDVKLISTRMGYRYGQSFLVETEQVMGRLVKYEVLKNSLEDAQSYFTVFGDFRYRLWEFLDPLHQSEQVCLYFCSVSDSYDRYMRSLRAGRESMKGDVLSNLYTDMSTSFSNITNGYGVFGALRVRLHYGTCYFTIIPYADGDPYWDCFATTWPAPLPDL